MSDKVLTKRYCGPCDEWVNGKACPTCGADTDKAEKTKAALMTRPTTSA